MLWLTWPLCPKPHEAVTRLRRRDLVDSAGTSLRLVPGVSHRAGSWTPDTIQHSHARNLPLPWRSSSTLSVTQPFLFQLDPAEGRISKTRSPNLVGD